MIGDAVVALEGAAAMARRLGYAVHVIAEPVVGEARLAAADLFAQIDALHQNGPRPLCVLSRGETTVTVTGAGRGGRNQELALVLSGRLAELATPAIAASIGTDGIDGPTDAAGAIVDSTTVARVACGRVVGGCGARPATIPIPFSARSAISC